MVDRATLTPSTPLDAETLRAELCQTTACPGLLQQIDEVTSIRFQQAINCCGLTSVAYALTALGCPTTVDDLFLTVGVGVESAVGDGMTLAEIYDACARYISREKLPIFADCYHFDSFTTSVDAFRAAMRAEGEAGLDDLLIFNFHSGIAHGWPTGGGGHFSLLTAWREDSDTVVMSDVHAIKYGAFWSTPTAQMYAAMNDKDSCGRARGAIRFGRLDKELQRPLPPLTPSLLDWTSPPPAHDPDHLARFIPFAWDDLLGVRNMEGVSALAAAMRLVEGDNARVAHLDEIMRALQESYTFHLDNFASPRRLYDMASRLALEKLTDCSSRIVKVKAYTGDALRNALREASCGQEGVAVMISYDLNVAVGAELVPPEKGEAGALTHGTRSWSLVASFDDKADVDDVDSVVIASAHNVILTGRLWTTSLQKLASAMKALGGGQCCLVVVDGRGKQKRGRGGGHGKRRGDGSDKDK